MTGRRLHGGVAAFGAFLGPPALAAGSWWIVAWSTVAVGSWLIARHQANP